jgi:hypothetical protein
MPINSSSIPALRVARSVRRKRRAEGGSLWGDVGGALPEAYGAGQPVRDLALTVPKRMLYDLPKEAIEHAQQNPLPGLRREDYTDVPADTSPDARSAFGGIGVNVPRVGWQPVDPMVGSSMETVGNIAGSAVPFARPGTAGIFGGRLARTADHEALAAAEKMTAEGVAPEQIWKETGWFKGADDQWRFEINDKGSGYKRIVGKGTIDNYPISTPHTTEMGQAYQHPDLYAAYPDLEKMQLDFRPLGGANGQYVSHPPTPGDLIPPHEAVTINTPIERYGENMQQARSTTLHELQHAVQRREGFVPGGNPQEMQDVVQAGIDARFLKGAQERGVSPEEALDAFRKTVGRDPHPAAGILTERLSLSDLERIADDPLEAYRRLYGEVEARNVQTRRDLPPEGRAHSFPPDTQDIKPELITLGRNRPGREGASNEPRISAETGPLDERGVAGPSGGGEGLQQAQLAAERRAGGRPALEGLPTGKQLVAGEDFIPGPVGRVHDVAERYMAEQRARDPNFGTFESPDRYHPIDPEHSAAIAKAYDEMKHAPNDPAVKNAYEALIRETLAQYQAIKASGLKITPVGGADYPYHGNPRAVAKDIADNNHMAFFKTNEGFGTLDKPDLSHPMLRPSGEKIGEHEMLNNDLFRVVHDYFGHVKNGYGFRAAGEDNAWRAHAAMYSDLARPAMTTETRGQNSWVNYGPHGEKNRTASGADTIYADQKVGLMPDWTMYDRGKSPEMMYHGSAADYVKPDLSKLGTGQGESAYGAGYYGSKSEPVAQHYRDMNQTSQLYYKGQPASLQHAYENISDSLKTGGIPHAQAEGIAEKIVQSMEMGLTPAQIKKREGQFFESIGEGKEFNKALTVARRYKMEQKKGHMYKWAIEADPEHFIDWQAPMSQQSEHVRNLLTAPMTEAVEKQRAALTRSIAKQKDEMARNDRPTVRQQRQLEEDERRLQNLDVNSLTGRDIYRRSGLPANDQAQGYLQSTERLRDMGIKGVKYLDTTSRAGDAGAQNFVVFDPKVLRLLRKYGVAGIPAAGAVAGAGGEDQGRARGGRAVRRAARRAKKAGGGGMFDWSGVGEAMPEAYGSEAPIRDLAIAGPKAMLDIPRRAFESSESMRRGEGYDPGPMIEAATLPMGTGAIAGVPVKGYEAVFGSGPVRRIADDTGAAMRAARESKRIYAEPEYTPGGSMIYNKGVEGPTNTKVQTVADPYRMMYPGIYRNPRILAEEAAARVGPEDPAMKRLFGVTRGDLRDMVQGRVGNEEPNLRLAKNPKGSLSAQNIQTPQNTERLQDILAEAGQHEGLRTADAWYIMDPVYRRMVELFGPEEAAQRYRMFNTSTAMASPGSDVLTEIQRGTAAHWLHNQGRFKDFKAYAGVPEEFRSRTAGFPNDMRYIGGHPYHRTAQADPMQKFFDTGAIQSDAPKVPLYAHASGVPETGFQTTGPVGDAHFSRGVGLSDTRKGPTDVQGSFSRAEYQTLQPWWQHEVTAPLGMESVPGQARLWTVLGPQTGVESALGAPKLELLAQQIMTAAKRLRISPEQARDLILSGKAGAGMLGGAIAAPAVADAMRERASGGHVNSAMDVARSIRRAKGGKVHVGPIIGETGGRADKVPMEVPDGAYVLTADHCSSMGEGNTLAGFKKLSAMFPKSKPSLMRGMKAQQVPIYAADGEFVISPEDIKDRYGDLDHGHKILDHWQTSERKEHVNTLRNLAPPAQD